MTPQLDRRDVPPLHRGEPLIGSALSNGCPHVEHSVGSTPFHPVDVVGGLQPRAFAPSLAAGFASLGPVPLRDGLAPFGLWPPAESELGGSEEFELSIDSRRLSSAFSAVSRSISSPCDSTSWSWTCARSACKRTTLRIVAQLLTLRLDQPVLIGQQPFLAGQQLVLAGNDLTQPRVGRTQPAHLRP